MGVRGGGGEAARRGSEGAPDGRTDLGRVEARHRLHGLEQHAHGLDLALQPLGLVLEGRVLLHERLHVVDDVLVERQLLVLGV